MTCCLSCCSIKRSFVLIPDQLLNWKTNELVWSVQHVRSKKDSYSSGLMVTYFHKASRLDVGETYWPSEERGHTNEENCLLPACVCVRDADSDLKSHVRLFIQRFMQPLILYLLLLNGNKRITFKFINDGPPDERCLQKFPTSVCCAHFSAGLHLFLMLNDAHPLCKFYGQMCIWPHSSFWMSVLDEASAGLLHSSYCTLTNDISLHMFFIYEKCVDTHICVCVCVCVRVRACIHIHTQTHNLLCNCVCLCEERDLSFSIKVI